MIVIADTGPVNYLILIGEIDILPALFQGVLVPPSVCEELKRPRAPDAVRTWIAQPPVWLEIRTPGISPGADLAHLDAGERDAILLAEELGADQIVIDEIRGRREAKRGKFLIPARWAFWRRARTRGCWIFRVPWTACFKPVFTSSRRSWTD